MTLQHGSLAPSAWVQRWSALVPSAAHVLDVACGTGRHVRWFAGRGAHVTALDRDAQAVAPLRTLPGVPVEVIVADTENAPWPLPGRRFDAVVVTNYLWLPLLPTLVEHPTDWESIWSTNGASAGRTSMAQRQSSSSLGSSLPMTIETVGAVASKGNGRR